MIDVLLGDKPVHKLWQILHEARAKPFQVRPCDGLREKITFDYKAKIFAIYACMYQMIERSIAYMYAI